MSSWLEGVLEQATQPDRCSAGVCVYVWFVCKGYNWKELQLCVGVFMEQGVQYKCMIPGWNIRKCFYLCPFMLVLGQWTDVRTWSHTHWVTRGMFPLCSDPVARGSAATGARGLRKDTGRFDWKQTLAYGKPALTLSPNNPLPWKLVRTLCVCGVSTRPSAVACFWLARSTS